MKVGQIRMPIKDTFEKLNVELNEMILEQKQMYDDNSQPMDRTQAKHVLENVTKLECFQKILLFIFNELTGSFLEQADPVEDNGSIDEIEAESKGMAKQKSINVTILGTTYSEKDWKHVLIRVCEVLYVHKPEIYSELDTKYRSARQTKRKQFARKKELIKQSPVKLSYGIWLETNFSSDSIKKICQRLLEIGGYTSDDIEYDPVK
jgi:hypothetical protein